MTPERDIERILAAWLEPGSSTMPDRLFDAVVDQIEREPQRRALHPMMRFQAMPTMFKLAAATVLALAIGITGRSLITGPDIGAVPSPSPLASPTEPPPLLPLAFGPLDAGTYALGGPSWAANFFSWMTATVPEGWQGIRGNTFANLFQTNDDFPLAASAWTCQTTSTSTRAIRAPACRTRQWARPSMIS